jgi:hypothetical protein
MPKTTKSQKQERKHRMANRRNTAAVERLLKSAPHTNHDEEEKSFVFKTKRLSTVPPDPKKVISVTYNLVFDGANGKQRRSSVYEKVTTYEGSVLRQQVFRFPREVDKKTKKGGRRSKNRKTQKLLKIFSR